MRGVDTFKLTDFHPSENVRQGHAEDRGGVASGVGVLRFEEEAADVRGGVGQLTPGELLSDFTSASIKRLRFD